MWSDLVKTKINIQERVRDGWKGEVDGGEREKWLAKNMETSGVSEWFMCMMISPTQETLSALHIKQFIYILYRWVGRMGEGG